MTETKREQTGLKLNKRRMPEDVYRIIVTRQTEKRIECRDKEMNAPSLEAIIYAIIRDWNLQHTQDASVSIGSPHITLK